MNIKNLTISRTQIHDYLSCGYRWQLIYQRGIQTTRVRVALDLGSAVHAAIKEAIQLYASFAVHPSIRPQAIPKSWTAKYEHNALQNGTKIWANQEKQLRGKYLTQEVDEQITNIRLEAFGIAKKALEFIDLPSWEVATWRPNPSHKMVPLCEVEIITPLAPWKGFRTIPDLVARRRADGKKAPWSLVDWKARGSFEDDDAEEINLQFSSMQHVMGIEIPQLEIDGSLLWQIKAQAPRKPNQNKDGSMSRAAIVTDWKTYAAALREANLDPADYQDMREKIEQVEWFRAIEQHRTMEECAREWHEIIEPAAAAIAKNPQVIRRWSHTPFACKGCWARDFCMAEMHNEDTDFLLETDYIDTHNPRKQRDLGEPKRTFILED